MFYCGGDPPSPLINVGGYPQLTLIAKPSGFWFYKAEEFNTLLDLVNYWHW